MTFVPSEYPDDYGLTKTEMAISKDVEASLKHRLNTLTTISTNHGHDSAAVMGYLNLAITVFLEKEPGQERQIAIDDSIQRVSKQMENPLQRNIAALKLDGLKHIATLVQDTPSIPRHPLHTKPVDAPTRTSEPELFYYYNPYDVRKALELAINMVIDPIIGSLPQGQSNMGLIGSNRLNVDPRKIGEIGELRTALRDMANDFQENDNVARSFIEDMRYQRFHGTTRYVANATLSQMYKVLMVDYEDLKETAPRLSTGNLYPPSGRQ